MRLALLGHPVAHSLSPRIFALLDKTVRYEALDVPPAGLGKAVERLRRGGCRGFNVTIPHKRAVIPFLTRLTAGARAVGAVNAVRLSRGGALGDNTDAAGFRDALEETGFRARGKDAVIYGAGGAARAVGYALAKMKARRVFFAARRPARAQKLAEDLNKRLGTAVFRDCAPPAPAGAALQVNATPLGMRGSSRRSPAPASSWDGCELAFDLVYGNDTPFLRAARSRGVPAIDGLSMLVSQALRAWELWTRPLGRARRKSLKRAIIKELT